MKSVATRQEIEGAIAMAVRKSSLECATFIGVRLEPRKDRNGANWSVKGVKYGKASRIRCDEAIKLIVEVLQSRFNIIDEAPVVEFRALVPAIKLFD